MRLHRVLAVGLKVLVGLRHDPRSVALMLLAPLMAMLVFGFAFGSETDHVAVLVVDEDGGLLASSFVGALDPVALDVARATDLAAARAQVAEGRVVAVLHFPPGFSEDAAREGGSPQGATLRLLLDTTRSQEAQVVLREVGRAGQVLAEAHGLAAPVHPALEYAFPEAKDARFIDAFVPGVMVFAAMLFTTLLTLLAFVGERTSGTLDRLRSTPVTEAEIVLGYELAFGLVATLQGILLLGVAVLVYDVLVVGSILLAGLVIVLVAIDAQAIGILVSAGAHREGQAVQVVPFIILPTFLLSGIFVPVASLPAWIRPVSWILPPTWGIDAMRNVMLRGWGIERVWLHVVVLALFAVASTGLAIAGLRRARG